MTTGLLKVVLKCKWAHLKDLETLLYADGSVQICLTSEIFIVGAPITFQTAEISQVI